MRRFALLLLLAACTRDRPVEAPVMAAESSAPMAVARSLEGGIVGQWEGVGTQDDGLSWPMIVKVTTTEPGACASVDYPSLRCRASWECTSATDGSLRAEEHLLEDGATRCVDNGAMTMRLRADGLLEWSWSAQGQTASATLRRSR